MWRLFAELKQAFRDVDTNGDGKISTAELARASHALGYNPTMKELEQMMAIVDEDSESTKRGLVDGCQW